MSKASPKADASSDASAPAVYIAVYTEMLSRCAHAKADVVRACETDARVLWDANRQSVRVTHGGPGRRLIPRPTAHTVDTTVDITTRAPKTPGYHRVPVRLKDGDVCYVANWFIVMGDAVCKLFRPAVEASVATARVKFRKHVRANISRQRGRVGRHRSLATEADGASCVRPEDALVAAETLASDRRFALLASAALKSTPLPPHAPPPAMHDAVIPPMHASPSRTAHPRDATQ